MYIAKNEHCSYFDSVFAPAGTPGTPAGAIPAGISCN